MMHPVNENESFHARLDEALYLLYHYELFRFWLMEIVRDWSLNDRLEAQFVLAMILHQTAQASEAMQDLYNFERAV